MTIYRCGYCGTVCKEDGSQEDINYLNSLEFKLKFKLFGDKAESVYGTCCLNPQQEYEEYMMRQDEFHRGSEY